MIGKLDKRSLSQSAISFGLAAGTGKQSWVAKKNWWQKKEVRIFYPKYFGKEFAKFVAREIVKFSREFGVRFTCYIESYESNDQAASNLVEAIVNGRLNKERLAEA
ncbi:MAG: hypothetical protein GXO21_04130 [Aquificae bacterium]|nr:hypothetical protein [Aquificota bacterium]